MTVKTKLVSYTNQTLFALINFIIGIIVLIISLGIDRQITENKCVDKDLRNANIGIMLTSTILTCLSASYIGCFMKCTDCFAKTPSPTGEETSVTGNAVFFNILSIILGIILIVFGSIIASKSKTCLKVKSHSTYIWGLGIFVCVVSLSILGIRLVTPLIKAKISGSSST